MSINIQIKFNIGDKVWVPDFYHDEWFVMNKNGGCVSNIEIQIDSNEKKVYYTIICDGRGGQKYPSRLCFNSYNECKQWCDNNNSK